MRIVRSEKGITMVSLVITVIIMIILAAVSLNGAFGDGAKSGIVAQAKNAIYKSELEDLKDFWESKIVDIDTEYLNYENLEDVMDIEQIPESLRGVFGVRKGRLYYKDGKLTDDKQDVMREMEIYADYVDPIKVTVKATIKKITEAKSADVIAVIDASSSMRTNSGTPKRFQNVANALNVLMETVLEADEKNRMGIVQFDYKYKTLLKLEHYTKNETEKYIESYGTGADGEVNGGKFAESLNPLKLNDYKLESGTYIQIGAAKAEQMFKNRTEAERKYKDDFLIILSDGEPSYVNYHLNYDKIITDFTEDSKNYASTNNDADGTKICGSGSDSYGRVYHTVKLLKEIKEKHQGNLKIYTINYGGGRVSKATMDPSKVNIDGLTNVSPYKDKLLELINPEGTDDVTRHINYTDKAYSDNDYTEQRLKDIFAEIGQDIIHKDDTVITMDETEKFTSLVVDGKMQYYDENGKLINYELDEAEGDVTVNVTAAIVVPTGVTDASGNIIRKPVTDAHGNIQRCKKVTKTYTIQEIKNGADPNLSYSNGSIVWNIEEDLQNEKVLTNIRGEAINALYTSGEMPDESAGEACEIVNVEIILPLMTYDTVE